jgi:hypothetical protein
MKRFALSLLGGILWPFCYAIATGLLSVYIDNARVRSVLNIPIIWPRVLYVHFWALTTDGSIPISETSLFVFILVCDVVVYTILTYFVLLFFFKPVEEKPTAPPLPFPLSYPDQFK